jgi:NTE family protein
MDGVNKKKRCLIVSGGGSKGAYAGGIVEYLITVEKKDYDMYVSSSTGTLVQLLTATGDISKLKTGYTTVRNKDIWKINPFKITDNNQGNVKAELNWWNVIRNLLPKLTITKRKKFPWFNITKVHGGISFGDSSNLLGLIKRFTSQKEYLRVKEELDKELVVCVVNATLKKVEYKSSENWGYEDFCEWTQASCSAYPFMSPVIKNNFQYIDGAILETTPIQEAIRRGATDIDVIILNEEVPEEKVEFMRNLMHGILTEVDMMYNELANNDVKIGKLKAKEEDVIINFYYTPRRLTNNSLIFNKDIMLGWWDEGYQYAKEKNFKTYKVVKGRKTKLIKKVSSHHKGQ